MKAAAVSDWDNEMLRRYHLDKSLIGYADTNSADVAYGVFEELQGRKYHFWLFAYSHGKNERLVAEGVGVGQALYLHTFLLQYRKPGVEVPSMPRDYGPEFGVFDETWKLRLLLKPVTTHEQLLERLAEANVMARQCYPEHITPDYTKRVSFGEQSYAKYQAYLKRYGMPPGPDEPPVDTHESIVAWLSQSRMRYEDRIVGARTVEIWCSNCMIDRRDGSWSIYGWNDGDGIGRYPPDELIRYYDEAMAYEYLLNAALEAVVTY